MSELLTQTLGPYVFVALDLDRLPPALADANQLELAILNLAINARDAMPGGRRARPSAGRGRTTTATCAGSRWPTPAPACRRR